VKKVAPRPVGAVASQPVLLAVLGLVLGVPDHLSKFASAVCELALVSVDALGPFLEVSADLRLVSGVGPVREHQFPFGGLAVGRGGGCCQPAPEN